MFNEIRDIYDKYIYLLMFNVQFGYFYIGFHFSLFLSELISIFFLI